MPDTPVNPLTPVLPWNGHKKGIWKYNTVHVCKRQPFVQLHKCLWRTVRPANTLMECSVCQAPFPKFAIDMFTWLLMVANGNHFRIYLRVVIVHFFLNHMTRGAWAPVSLHRPDFSVTMKRRF